MAALYNLLRYSKGSCFVIFFLFAVISGTGSANAFWGKPHYEKGNEYLSAEQYDSAIAEYLEALKEKIPNPSIMAIATNLGVAYHYNGNYEQALKYYKIGIDASKERAYYGYINLAGLHYQYGDIKEAYRQSLKARELVDSPNYYNLEAKSPYKSDVIKNIVISTNEFIALRLLARDLNSAIELKNQKEAAILAQEIAEKHYHVNFGAWYSGNTIATLQDGSIADINGLLKGDKILSIDGISIRDNHPTDAWNVSNELFDKYGSTVVIKVLRKGRELHINCRMSYPEVESAHEIVADTKSHKTSATKYSVQKAANGPWLKIIEPRTNRGVKITGTQNIAFRILGSDIRPLKSVKVNGNICAVEEADQLEQMMLPGHVKRYTLLLQLSKGVNRFEILATNDKGEKLIQNITVDCNTKIKRPPEPMYNRRIAVVIGINQYYPWPGLEFAVNDAKAVKQKLLGMGFDKVIELYDKDATRARILRVLMDDLPAVMGANDCLFVFFAGHGATEELPGGEQEGYIIPVDADEQNFQGTAISMSSIHSMIKRYRAKHKMFVFDSCYSGLGLKRSGGGKKNSLYADSMALKPVSLILTAGGKDEQASEEKGHGLFTKAFLDALTEEDGNKDDGYVFATDVAQKVRKKVHDKSEGKQIPQFGILSGEGDFIFEHF